MICILQFGTYAAYKVEKFILDNWSIYEALRVEKELLNFVIYSRDFFLTVEIFSGQSRIFFDSRDIFLTVENYFFDSRDFF